MTFFGVEELPKKVVFDNAWWVSVSAAHRSAYEMRNKTANITRKELNKVRYIKFDRYEPEIWVSRVGFTYVNYLGKQVKAKKVKQMKVPALCYWPGGVLPPGFNQLT